MKEYSDRVRGMGDLIGKLNRDDAVELGRYLIERFGEGDGPAGVLAPVIPDGPGTLSTTAPSPTETA